MLESRQVNPYRSETNGIAESAVRRAALLVQWASQKCGGERRWNASVICETYKTKWQTESHRMKEELELHLMSSDTIWSRNLVSSNLYERQKSSSSIWYKRASRKIHRTRSEFGRRLDRRLPSRTGTTSRIPSPPRFASKGSTPLELESINCMKHLNFLVQTVP